MFNYARTSYTAAQLAAISDEAAAQFIGCARYAWCGGILVNSMANDVPDTAKAAALTADLTAIFDHFEGAGMTVGMGTTRYLAYSGTGAPADQSTGARAYDSAVTNPFIASRIPDCYDTATGRPRYDEYLLDLYRRDLHSDYVHGTAAQYALERALIADTFLRRVYTGSWSYVPQIEVRIAAAEAARTNEATALTSLTEAGYAIRALDPGAPRAAFQARYDAARPVALFFEAKRLIAVAELSTATADKSAAQAALDLAVAQGFSGMAAPDTAAAQQARIDAIVSASFDQIVQIELGNATSAGGWNGIAPSGNISLPGTSYPLVDKDGAATGVAFVIESVIGPSNSVGSATGSMIGEFPDPHLRSSIATSNGGGINCKITGLNPARSYDLVAVGSGVNSLNRRTALVVNGTNRGDRSDLDRLNNPWRVTNIAPTAGGEIDVNFVRGTGSGYVYAVGLVLKRHA